jgi:hypothetical protein
MSCINHPFRGRSFDRYALAEGNPVSFVMNCQPGAGRQKTLSLSFLVIFP